MPRAPRVAAKAIMRIILVAVSLIYYPRAASCAVQSPLYMLCAARMYGRFVFPQTVRYKQGQRGSRGGGRSGKITGKNKERGRKAAGRASGGTRGRGTGVGGGGAELRGMLKRLRTAVSSDSGHNTARLAANRAFCVYHDSWKYGYSPEYDNYIYTVHVTTIFLWTGSNNPPAFLVI